MIRIGLSMAETNIFDRRFGDVAVDFCTLIFCSIFIPFIVPIVCILVIADFVLDIVMLLDPQIRKHRKAIREDIGRIEILFPLSLAAYKHLMARPFLLYCKMIVDFICGKKIE